MFRLGWKRQIEWLGRELDKHTISNEKDGNGPPRPIRWRGRRVIPTRKWREILDFRRSEVFGFLPDSFIDSPFLGYFDSKSDVSVRDKIRAWKEDYYALLVYMKDPDYGKELCNYCLLNTERKENYDTTGIRGAIADSLKRYVRENPEDLPEDPQQDIQSSCSVCNKFRCPYGPNSRFGPEELLAVGLMVNTVIHAIEEAKWLQANSRVQVRTTQEVSLAVKDPKRLKALLEQYQEARATSYLTEDLMRMIVDFFTNRQEDLFSVKNLDRFKVSND